MVISPGVGGGWFAPELAVAGWLRRLKPVKQRRECGEVMNDWGGQRAGRNLVFPIEPDRTNPKLQWSEDVLRE